VILNGKEIMTLDEYKSVLDYKIRIKEVPKPSLRKCTITARAMITFGQSSAIFDTMNREVWAKEILEDFSNDKFVVPDRPEVGFTLFPFLET
jgi:hypothetical protein